MAISSTNRGESPASQRSVQGAELEGERVGELLKPVPAAIAMLQGPEHRWTYVNPAYVRLVGRNSAKELLGKPIRETVPEVEGQGLFELLDQVYRSGEPFSGTEKKVRLPRGPRGEAEDVYINFVCQPLRNPAGVVEGVVVHAVDVTPQVESRVAQQRAEEALRQSEERLRAALAASNTGTYRWNPERGEFLEFDESLKELFGLAADEAVRTREDLIHRVHPTDIAALAAAVERSRRGADFELEYRIVLPDGSTRWLYDRGKMVFRNGKPEYLVGACTDTTSRKLEESAHLQLAAIVESSDDAIVSKDLNGIVTSWNAAAERLFGYKAAEMIGRPITTIIPPELHPDETRILEKLRRGERIEHFETVRVTKSGEHIEVSLTISPVKNERGRVVGAAKIARDITQRKKTEDALRMSDKLATTGRLAATVAHEINNPLESVVNLVYLAKSHRALPGKVREYLQAAEEELDRVSQLTRQALGFYREKTAATSVRVASIISQLRTVFSPRITNKRIDLQVEVEGDPEIVAVPGELRQLFANLLSNSIDAVPTEGTIRVRVSREREYNSSGTQGVRVTIADSGPGIEPAHRARVFEPFFTTKKEVGTGLGLWVSKGIVERHGGRIRMRSRVSPGRSGTVFSVFLPANGAESRALHDGSELKEAV